ncbi:MAG: pentapeptide repeat-containing protein [Desulfuromonadales bacterium]
MQRHIFIALCVTFSFLVFGFTGYVAQSAANGDSENKAPQAQDIILSATPPHAAPEKKVHRKKHILTSKKHRKKTAKNKSIKNVPAQDSSHSASNEKSSLIAVDKSISGSRDDHLHTAVMVPRAALLEDVRRILATHRDFRGKNLSGLEMTGADFSGSDFTDVNLSNADLYQANFSGANLTRANLKGAALAYANFGLATLQETDLSATNLFSANLEKAQVTRTKFRYSYAAGSRMNDAVLDNADFRSSNFSGANLDGCKFSNSKTDGMIIEGIRGVSDLSVSAITSPQEAGIDSKP